MLIVNICHFKLPRISLFKKMSHCNLDIIGYWGIGTICSNFFQLTISLFWLKFACHGVIRRLSFIIIARINHFYWLSFLVGWNSYKANDPSKSTIKTLLEQIQSTYLSCLYCRVWTSNYLHNIIDSVVPGPNISMTTPVFFHVILQYLEICYEGIL